METNRLRNHGTALLDDPDPSTASTESTQSTASDRGNPAHIANSARRFNIPGDLIAKTCADLPDDQRAAIKWASNYCRLKNISCGDLGNELKQDNGRPYSADSVYAVFTGRRDPNSNSGSYDRFCQAVETLRKRVEETSAREGRPFIETHLSRRIFAACRNAFEKKRVVFIFGDSHIGKSRSIAEYARRHNHGETILVRMPTGGALKHFLSELALRLGIGQGNSTGDLRRRIIESFDDRTLLAIDEGEQCLSTREGYRSLEFAREIHDRRKCGLVILGALDLRSELRSNFTLVKLARRGVKPLQLPLRPSAADLNAFAASFDLDPAPDKEIPITFTAPNAEGEDVQVRVKASPFKIQNEVIREHSLGRWLAILEDAQDIAKETRRSLAWPHVIAAHAQFQLLEDPQ